MACLGWGPVCTQPCRASSACALQAEMGGEAGAKGITGALSTSRCLEKHKFQGFGGALLCGAQLSPQAKSESQSSMSVSPFELGR